MSGLTVESAAAQNSGRRRVVIVQRLLPGYRVTFFRALRALLADDGIDLELCYGDGYAGIETATVHMDEPWAHYIHNRYADIFGIPVVWQPCWAATRSADLVVIEHANRNLLNYPLLLEPRRLRRAKIALWGHGRNLQVEQPNAPRELLKRQVLTRADWWFAYTESTAEEIAKAGFPRERITAVQNSIDTHELEQSVANVTTQQLAHLRAKLGIGLTDPVAVFCGAMHKDKRLPFLLEACDRIRTRLPDFHVVFLGDGPERHLVDAASHNRHWIHVLGSMRGPERAAYLKLGAAMLMPGLVGLAVVDCFVAQTPIISTKLPIHSPEFSYLTDRVNGLVTDFDVGTYAEAVCCYLADPQLQETLRRGCSEASHNYSLDRMVENFAIGVNACLRAQG